MIRWLKQFICNRGRRAFIASGLLLSLSGNVFAAGVGSICFKEICFRSEIARTQIEKQQGLMGREKLPDNEGMLFFYERESSPAFWMKDMLLPIDMIWVNQDMHVVYIKENALPKSYPEAFGPGADDRDAKYILEVVAGFSKNNNLKVGDEVIFQK